MIETMEEGAGWVWIRNHTGVYRLIAPGRTNGGEDGGLDISNKSTRFTTALSWKAAGPLPRVDPAVFISPFEINYPKYLLFNPMSPAKPEPKSQTAPGMGTGLVVLVLVKEKLKSLYSNAPLNRSSKLTKVTLGSHSS